MNPSLDPAHSNAELLVSLAHRCNHSVVVLESHETLTSGTCVCCMGQVTAAEITCTRSSLSQSQGGGAEGRPHPYGKRYPQLMTAESPPPVGTQLRVACDAPVDGHIPMYIYGQH